MWAACLATAPLCAQNIVSATLAASLTSGSLSGTYFPVRFSYHADQVATQGESYLELDSFDFVLLGVQFTRSDILQGGQVIFRDGKLEDVTASFQVHLPPNAPVKNITFGFGGNGVIGYIDLAGAYGSGSFALATASGVVNAASFSQPISPGSLASIFGSGMAFGSQPAVSSPLPVTLAGVSVSIAGITAPVLFVSPGQINFQVPWGLAPGSAQISITNNGFSLPPLQAIVQPFAPAIFSLQSGQAAAVNSDGALAAPANSIVPAHPAKPGDAIMIFATGLGAVHPSITTGEASADTSRNTDVVPTVLVGGIPAAVTFAGLSPQFVGVNQVNVVVPQTAPGVVPLQIELGGIRTTDRVSISVGPP